MIRRPAMSNRTAGLLIMAVLMGLAQLCIIEAGNNVGATLVALIPLGFAVVIGLAIRRI